MLPVQEVYIRSEPEPEPEAAAGENNNVFLSICIGMNSNSQEHNNLKKRFCGQHDTIWSPLFTLDCVQLE